MGRDFLSNFHNFEFDFSNHDIRIGRLEKKKSSGRIAALRSKIVVTVHCNKSKSLIIADLELAAIEEVSGMYTTPCQVFPNVADVFQITLINVNEIPVELNNRKHL